MAPQASASNASKRTQILVEAQLRKKEIEKRLGRPIQTDGNYEDIIANEVVNPRTISVQLADIGGLDHIIEDLRRNIITPMMEPTLFRTTLLRQKRGVLLYGPPGTGKTMLAKALARECGACFINLKASTLLSKWYGDTNKLIAAVWSLAYKLQPCIVFIDEVDALLGTRRSMEHEATTAMKTEFMQARPSSPGHAALPLCAGRPAGARCGIDCLWEGFETASNQIVVLGATNKKDSLDDAVMRRFSLQYEIKLPEQDQRRSILQLTLMRHQVEMEGRQVQGIDADLLADRLMCNSAGLRVQPLAHLAERTEGFSGSDLNELCSQAATMPVHEAIAERERNRQGVREGTLPLDTDMESLIVEPLSLRHFETVLETFHPPSRAAQQEQRRRQQESHGAGGQELIRQIIMGLQLVRGPAAGGAGV
ncbi:hypothetical protein N2152v2_004627 [Parachlorella kessleri]